MLNIERLLNKRSWTGRELGQLAISIMLSSFNSKLRGEKDRKTVSTAEFHKMLSTLKDPHQIDIYNSYIAVHDWFYSNYAHSNAFEQQALYAHSRLAMIISNALVSEQMYKYISGLPAILTEKQYKDYVSTRTREILKPNGEEMSFNIFNIVELAIDYYINLLRTDPRKKNPLKPLKKKLEKEVVTDPHILEWYCEVYGLGYYELKDGTRSDAVSSEIWASKIIALSTDSPASSGSGEQVETIADNVYRTQAKKDYQKDTNEDDNSVNNYLQSIISCENPVTATAHLINASPIVKEQMEAIAVWHYYSTPPEPINKWDILESNSLYELFPALADEGTEEEQIAQIEAFRGLFPEVTTAILKDMANYFEQDIETFTASKWLANVYSWQDLYDRDIYGFRNTYVGDTSIFEENGKAIFNGIAILRPSDLLNKSPRIDPETGYYTPPTFTGLVDMSLQPYFTDNPDYATAVEDLEALKKTLIESVYFLKGFNKILDLIEEYYLVDDFEVAKVDITRFEDLIKSFNQCIYSLYNQIKYTDYEDKELKEKKLEALRDVFTPINLEQIEIPQSKIDKAIQTIQNGKAFNGGIDDIRITLCYVDTAFYDNYIAEEKGVEDYYGK